ncbi:MAG: peptide chain release factor 3, partial [Flammeovirgaceae bacterium]|nr:peptide chain release factor 3 [Flammeovirgaceae bacterium]
ACWFTCDDKDKFEEFANQKIRLIAEDKEKRKVFLTTSDYELRMEQQNFPEIKFHFTSEFDS